MSFLKFLCELRMFISTTGEITRFDNAAAHGKHVRKCGLNSKYVVGVSFFIKNHIAVWNRTTGRIIFEINPHSMARGDIINTETHIIFQHNTDNGLRFIKFADIDAKIAAGQTEVNVEDIAYAVVGLNGQGGSTQM